MLVDPDQQSMSIFNLLQSPELMIVYGLKDGQLKLKVKPHALAEEYTYSETEVEQVRDEVETQIRAREQHRFHHIDPTQIETQIHASVMAANASRLQLPSNVEVYSEAERMVEDSYGDQLAPPSEYQIEQEIKANIYSRNEHRFEQLQDFEKREIARRITSTNPASQLSLPLPEREQIVNRVRQHNPSATAHEVDSMVRSSIEDAERDLQRREDQQHQQKLDRAILEQINAKEIEIERENSQLRQQLEQEIGYEARNEINRQMNDYQRLLQQIKIEIEQKSQSLMEDYQNQRAQIQTELEIEIDNKTNDEIDRLKYENRMLEDHIIETRDQRTVDRVAQLEDERQNQVIEEKKQQIVQIVEQWISNPDKSDSFLGRIFG